MADFMHLVSLLREQVNSTASRSDVLKPLAFLVLILASAFCVSLFSNSQDWVLICLLTALFASIGLYGFAYVYCLVKDRDALRSEKYSLQKFALEQKMMGDSTAGLFKENEIAPVTAVIDADQTKQIELKS